MAFCYLFIANSWRSELKILFLTRSKKRKQNMMYIQIQENILCMNQTFIQQKHPEISIYMTNLKEKKPNKQKKTLSLYLLSLLLPLVFPGRFDFVFVFLHIVCHYVYFLWNSVYFTVLISYDFILFLFFMIYFFISNFFQQIYISLHFSFIIEYL